MLAAPATGSHAASAATVNRVNIPDSQPRLPGCARDLFDAQREGMKIQQQLSVTHQSAVRHVGIAQDEMTSRMSRGVTAHQSQHLSPVIQFWVIAVHEFRLAKVNRL